MTTTFEVDCTGLVKTFKELERENAKLKRMLAQKEREHLEELDKIESEYNEEILRLRRQLVFTKSLVNIPDNLTDCVKELIKERLKGLEWFAFESSNLDWIEQDEAPFFSVDLQAAFSGKDSPKGEGRKSAK